MDFIESFPATIVTTQALPWLRLKHYIIEGVDLWCIGLK